MDKSPENDEISSTYSSNIARLGMISPDILRAKRKAKVSHNNSGVYSNNIKTFGNIKEEEYICSDASATPISKTKNCSSLISVEETPKSMYKYILQAFTKNQSRKTSSKQDSQYVESSLAMPSEQVFEKSTFASPKQNRSPQNFKVRTKIVRGEGGRISPPKRYKLVAVSMNTDLLSLFKNHPGKHS